MYFITYKTHVNVYFLVLRSYLEHTKHSEKGLLGFDMLSLVFHAGSFLNINNVFMKVNHLHGSNETRSEVIKHFFCPSGFVFKGILLDFGNEALYLFPQSQINSWIQVVCLYMLADTIDFQSLR